MKQICKDTLALTPKDQMFVKQTNENPSSFITNAILVKCLQNFNVRHEYVSP